MSAALSGSTLVIGEAVLDRGQHQLHLEVGHAPQRAVAKALEQIRPRGEVVGRCNEDIGWSGCPRLSVEPTDLDSVVLVQQRLHMLGDDALTLWASQCQPRGQSREVDKYREPRLRPYLAHMPNCGSPTTTARPANGHVNLR